VNLSRRSATTRDAVADPVRLRKMTIRRDKEPSFETVRFISQHSGKKIAIWCHEAPFADKTWVEFDLG
jgi:hypothetical protein